MLPTYKEAERRCINGSATPLDKFILHYTPAGRNEEWLFREQLEQVLSVNDFGKKSGKVLRAKLKRVKRK